MKIVYKIRLKIERYECIVDLLGAEEHMKGMLRKPNIVILEALQQLARMMEMPRLTKEW